MSYEHRIDEFKNRMTSKLELVTEGRSTKLSLAEAVDIFKKNCNTYNFDQRVYRGLDNYSHFLAIEPKNFTRASANTTNEYTLIMDNMIPVFTKFPKRSQSIICTSDQETAEAYGDVFRVIPFDGANVGVTKEAEDFWFAFPHLKAMFGVSSLDKFNDIVLNILPLIIAYDPANGSMSYDWEVARPYKNIKQLKADIKKADLVIKSLKDSEEFDDLDFHIGRAISPLGAQTPTNFVHNIKSLESALIECLSPSKNNIDTFPFTKLRPSFMNPIEIWTDSKCLLIHDDYIDDFKQAVGS